jgi:EAL domain-containing protein (putative c-di-GMP-specific phosphodiesterase class I)
MLHELRAIGIRISLDDFGTGFSSLSYLRSFPFDKIKIDKSFIHDISHSRDSRAIVNAVIDLGRSLGISTTAEGVETEDQLELVRRQGCNEVQGFLFSTPLPAGAVSLLLANREVVKDWTRMVDRGAG